MRTHLATAVAAAVICSSGRRFGIVNARQNTFVVLLGQEIHRLFAIAQ